MISPRTKKTQRNKSLGQFVQTDKNASPVDRCRKFFQHEHVYCTLLVSGSQVLRLTTPDIDSCCILSFIIDHFSFRQRFSVSSIHCCIDLLEFLDRKRVHDGYKRCCCSSWASCYQIFIPLKLFHFSTDRH